MPNLAAALLGLGVLGLGLRLLRYTRTDFPELLHLTAMASAAGAACLALILFVAGILGGLTRPVLYTLAIGLCMQAVPELRRLWRERIAVGAAPPALGLPSVALCLLLAGAWLLQHVPPLFFDTLVYHLGLPSQYLLHGAIVYLPNFHYSSMPGNVELLYSFGLALGDIPLARLFGFGGLVFGGLQVASLASFWRVRSGMVAAILAIGLPVSLFMGIHNGVDHWVAVFICATLLATLRWIRDGRAADSLWAGVFAGAAIGCKYTALYHLAPLAVIGVASRLRRSPNTGETVASVCLAVAAALCFGGGWYVRNIVNTGNPVYPAFYSVLGGDGWSEAAARRVADDVAHGGGEYLTLTAVLRMPVDLVLDPDRFGEFGRVGPMFWILLAVGILGAVRQSPMTLAWMMLVVPFWMLTSLNLRYLLPVLWVLAACAGGAACHWMDTRRPVWPRRIVTLTLAVFTMTSIEWVGYYETQVFKVHEYLLGRVERDEYIALGLDYFPVARRTAELPGDAVILLVGETRLLYVERRVVVSSAYDESILTDIIRQGQTVDGTLCEMARRGITHLLYSPRETSRFESLYGYFDGLDDDELAVLVSLFQSAAMIEAQEGVSLLALPESSPPCRPASAGTADPR